MSKQSHSTNTYKLKANSWIHFIGICGVGMGALAIMMKKKGYKVTGSDVGFYPPISTHLKKHGIEYYAGWHAERIGANCHSEAKPKNPLANEKGSFAGVQDDSADPDFRRDDSCNSNQKPDLVVVGNVAGSENPEWKFVKENKIPYVSYPELIARELVRPNSIVCAGTYGKTSTSALLAWILINASKKPAYMFGGLSSTPELASDDLGGDWSVLEGDEYKTSRWDNSPKFSRYSPTHLLLTAVKWDHADVYPTEKSYFEAFDGLMASIPKDGLAVISEHAFTVISSDSEKSPRHSKSLEIPRLVTPRNDNLPKIVKYGQSEDCDYRYFDVVQTKDGLSFKIIVKKLQVTSYKLQAPVIGSFQAENICGAFAMAHSIGIEPEIIIASIASFSGIKRRLEKRGTTASGAVVFDDIAHSPAKVKSVLETLTNIYKCHSEAKPKNLSTNEKGSFAGAQDDNTQSRLFCVFEPNSGNRKIEALPGYDHAFGSASEVIIPRLTKLKNDEEFIDGQKLRDIIAKTHSDVKYIDDDIELVNYLNQNAKTNDVVVFSGSHGFRGMIDKMISDETPPRPPLKRGENL